MSMQNMKIQRECARDVANSGQTTGLSALSRAREECWFARQNDELIRRLSREGNSDLKPPAEQPASRKNFI